MNVQKTLVRLVALTVVVAMPVMGMAGIASAHATKAAHHKKHKGGAGSGSGGATPLITVVADPNPLVETGQSEVHAVIQVETNPAFAGDPVIISSSQLTNSCAGGITFEEITGTAIPLSVSSFTNFVTLTLDNDGNATVKVDGTFCAPGSSVIEADLSKAPYYTALTTLVAEPPQVTPEGLTGYPNDEVETSDLTVAGSDVYAVFYVEDSPVYAEQKVEIASAQLEARCQSGWAWESGNNGTRDPGGTGLTIGANTNNANTTLDDDGNATFDFFGASCAAGDSQVIADVESGSHDTFTYDYTILPPAITI
jgi:hypothetical protein